MTDDHPSPPEPTTVTGAAVKLANGLISVLPPAFLVLVALNVVFIGTVLWFLTAQMEARTQIFIKVLERCIEMEQRKN